MFFAENNKLARPMLVSNMILKYAKSSKRSARVTIAERGGKA